MAVVVWLEMGWGWFVSCLEFCHFFVVDTSLPFSELTAYRDGEAHNPLHTAFSLLSVIVAQLQVRCRGIMMAQG